MTLRVVGVGLGRTGTRSLKVALEVLLGQPCFHMLDLADRIDRVTLWVEAMAGTPNWPAIFEGYAATVDWPGVALWREVVAEYPDALVLLSMRASADVWWESARSTIFASYNGGEAAAVISNSKESRRALYARNGIDPTDGTSSKRAYERHLTAVRAEVSADRLLEWMPGDSWWPLCDALGLPLPNQPFPHLNSTEEFRTQFSVTP